MKLLICTQKVDKNDSVLGFFHRWIEEFAKHCEMVTVICLEKGEYSLPNNVKVLSLGKEHGVSRLKYLFCFYRYTWKYRKKYDSVFVHMNPIYAVLGGVLWKIMKKKVVLWYNHVYGDVYARVSKKIVKNILYTSPFSFFSTSYSRATQMSVGIDTSLFSPEDSNVFVQNSKIKILFLGRISAIKNVDILIKAAKILDKKGIDFVLDIVGSAGPKDKGYLEKIRKESMSLEKVGRVRFLGPIPHHMLPDFYRSHDFYVNLTNSGSLDKTIFEAMACGSLVCVSNKSIANLLEERLKNILVFKETDEDSLVLAIVRLVKLSENDKILIKNKLRQFVVDKHGLGCLIKKINYILYK